MNKKLMIVALFILALVIPNFGRADQILQYEPSVVEVSGKLIKGKFQHPNGNWIDFLFLKLDTPAEIIADGKNLINVSERGIKEIQLYSNKSKARKILNKKSGKHVHVKGTVFHSHTAWHVRPLVMDVMEIK
jgi:hypothetical protein